MAEDFFIRLAILEEKVASIDRLTQLEFSAQEKSVSAALAASEKAILKAEVSGDKRFELLNEFRQQSKDKDETFCTLLAHDDLTKRVTVLASRIDQSQGEGKGLQLGWSILLGAIVIAGTILAMLHK